MRSNRSFSSNSLPDKAKPLSPFVLAEGRNQREHHPSRPMLTSPPHCADRWLGVLSIDPCQLGARTRTIQHATRTELHFRLGVGRDSQRSRFRVTTPYVYAELGDCARLRNVADERERDFRISRAFASRNFVSGGIATTMTSKGNGMGRRRRFALTGARCDTIE